MTRFARRLLSAGVVAAMLAIGTPTHALQLTCRLPSAKDGSLLETLRIAVGTQGAVSVWRKRERTSYWDGDETNLRVLYHSLTTSDGNEGGTKFSVLVIESRFVSKKLPDAVSPPEVLFIDWGKGNLAQVNVPFTLQPVAQVDTRWQCERTD